MVQIPQETGVLVLHRFSHAINRGNAAQFIHKCTNKLNLSRRSDTHTILTRSLPHFDVWSLSVGLSPLIILKEAA